MSTSIPSHASRQTNANICVYITFSAATIAVVCRLIARRLTRLRFAFDDYLTVVAYIFAAAWTGIVICWIQFGLGCFLEDISIPSDLVLLRSRLLLFHLELAYALSLGFSKLAILAFYWRMFKNSTIRLPIQILSVATIIWLIFRVGTVIVHSFIDIAILVLPVIEVHNLHLPLYQRLGIMSMFCSGIFVCIASVVVIVYSYSYDTTSPEMPWDIAPIVIWATVEVNMAIIAACLPMLRPIFLIVIGHPLTKNSSSQSNSYGKSRHPQSFSAHKLTIIATAHDEIDKFETSSINQLAGTAKYNESIRSVSAYEMGHGNRVSVVVGSQEDSAGDFMRTSEDKPRGEGNWRGLEGLGGILVSRETRIDVSEAV